MQFFRLLGYIIFFFKIFKYSQIISFYISFELVFEKPDVMSFVLDKSVMISITSQNLLKNSDTLTVKMSPNYPSPYIYYSD